MDTLSHSIDVSCAVEVFIAAALLHKELPDRSDFSIQEIVKRASIENLNGEFRPGIHVHASQHCIANRVPNPSKHRMLFATGKHTRRLLQRGDEVHPARTGKIFPDEHEIPPQYLPLLAWAKARYETAKGVTVHKITSTSASLAETTQPKNEARWLESLFELQGLGKEIWKDIDPDEYVRQLREDWE